MADPSFEPFIRSFFDPVFKGAYAALASGWQDLALVFAILAFAFLVDPVAKSLGKPALLHSFTKSALNVGDFMKDVTVASLCTLHLACGYFLNSEGSLDELYVLVGLAMQLAIVGGYHRGSSPEQEYR